MDFNFSSLDIIHFFASFVKQPLTPLHLPNKKTKQNKQKNKKKTEKNTHKKAHTHTQNLKIKKKKKKKNTKQKRTKVQHTECMIVGTHASICSLESF